MQVDKKQNSAKRRSTSTKQQKRACNWEPSKQGQASITMISLPPSMESGESGEHESYNMTTTYAVVVPRETRSRSWPYPKNLISLAPTYRPVSSCATCGHGTFGQTPHSRSGSSWSVAKAVRSGAAGLQVREYTAESTKGLDYHAFVLVEALSAHTAQLNEYTSNHNFPLLLPSSRAHLTP